MRLNWNNLGKGLESIAGAKRAYDLAQESARYDVTQGAYGPELQQNIEQVQGLQQQAIQGGMSPEEAQAQYAPALAELQRRQGLTAPDYSVASGPTNYASRQEARQAAAPLRAEGLAGVYRQYGDVTRADELEARAYDQQRAIEAEKRAVTAEGRAQKGFETSQTLTGLQITEAQRKAALEKGNDDARKALAELRAAGGPINSQTLADVAKRTGGNYDTLLQSEIAQLGYTKQSGDAEIANLRRDLAKAATGGVPTLNKFLTDKFDPDKTDNKTPEIVQTKRGFVVMYDGKEMQDYGAHKSLDALIGTVEGRITGDTLGTLKTLAQIRQAEAQAAESAAGVGLKGAQADYYRKQGEKPGLKQKVADFKEVYGREPTEDEKGILAGLANKPREFTAADVNARAKLMVEGGMMDPDDPTKPISPQKAIQIAQAELSGQPYVSAVDQLILDMQAARGKTPAAVPKKPGALTVATPVGQQLLDVGNVIVPPQPYARPFTTKEERLRGLSIPAR